MAEVGWMKRPLGKRMPRNSAAKALVGTPASGSRSPSHCKTRSATETAQGQVRARQALSDSMLREEKYLNMGKGDPKKPRGRVSSMLSLCKHAGRSTSSSTQKLQASSLSFLRSAQRAGGPRLLKRKENVQGSGQQHGDCWGEAGVRGLNSNGKIQ